MQRDNFTCQLCFSTTETLHVHHLAYEGLYPWDTPDNNLITLCEECHKKLENDKKVSNNSPFFTKINNLRRMTIYFEMAEDEELFETIFQIYKVKKTYQDKREQGKILQEDSKEYLI
jgi:NAD-dependent SIR2 family protein deacetylase